MTLSLHNPPGMHHWLRQCSDSTFDYAPLTRPAVERNGVHIRADKLQQLHTLHNLADLLGPDGRCAAAGSCCDSCAPLSCGCCRLGAQSGSLAYQGCAERQSGITKASPQMAGQTGSSHSPRNCIAALAGACQAWRPRCEMPSWHSRPRS